MAEPPPRRLRAARRGGLTSPGPVRTCHARQGHPITAPSQEPRTSRRTGERQDAHARNHPWELLVQESDRKRATGIGRWIEAKPHAVRCWPGGGPAGTTSKRPALGDVPRKTTLTGA